MTNTHLVYVMILIGVPILWCRSRLPRAKGIPVREATVIGTFIGLALALIYLLLYVR